MRVHRAAYRGILAHVSPPRAAAKPYVSPFELADRYVRDPGSVESTRPKVLRQLHRTERHARDLLEIEHATVPVCEWVSGGRTSADRARRAEVAVYLRRRILQERERGQVMPGNIGAFDGWPDRWLLSACGREADARAKRRRDTGRSCAWESLRPEIDAWAIPTERPAKKTRGRKPVDVAGALAALEAAKAQLLLLQVNR